MTLEGYSLASEDYNRCRLALDKIAERRVEELSEYVGGLVVIRFNDPNDDAFIPYGIIEQQSYQSGVYSGTVRLPTEKYFGADAINMGLSAVLLGATEESVSIKTDEQNYCTISVPHTIISSISLS